MNILNALLSMIFALLAGLILVFCITIMACVLLFSTKLTITMGKTKMVTTFQQTAPGEEFARPIVTSEPTVLTIEFDEAELLAKLVKEIAPNYGMIMQVAVRNQTWAIVSLNVQPSNSTWNTDLHLKEDKAEVKGTEEHILVFICKQLSENCTLENYESQKKPVIQSLELSDVIKAFLRAFRNSYQASPVQETDASVDVKTEEEEIFQSSEE
ncbi:uncharacterized protein LOC128421107 [Podarcis raffonei]|uniref:uncharacterized protein LOC128421107 n=1 Tax=Podarcis raffonei TaxID=65483 RepID=UPI0023295C6C|nr:uncharacterized protein LOC128421107 [Podarcis raffonei]